MRLPKEGWEIGRGESVEGELNRLIEKRHDRRVTDQGERPAEEVFMESERAYFARLQAERRAEWCEYHRGQAESLRRALAALVAEHEAAAERLGA
ncbi:MAG: hypothetical protein AVDCRST_MAG02-3454 [uncultured Rubrobacteraceae bacterium]|uniref:Uncharacterized protein n=1 Tax=uncultured Rubrobacteraceae bacterium TaxID=349277 RepID=A0A6J4RIT3_9ACTN|nr:MAG: hypothetical protein AVDCRST_MAG02-3454 [uncultured Rubrobacteraceae bacterium]